MIALAYSVLQEPFGVFTLVERSSTVHDPMDGVDESEGALSFGLPKSRFLILMVLMVHLQKCR
jgi:hypothetical protein